MTDKEAYKLIGERAEELSKIESVQAQMLKMAANDSKEAAEKWLYQLAIATLAQ